MTVVRSAVRDLVKPAIQGAIYAPAGGGGGGGFSAETQAIIDRVETDGGTIHDSTALGTFVDALVAGSVYSTSIIDGMWLPGLASKIDGSRNVSRIYDLNTNNWDLDGDASTANQQVLTTAAAGIDGLPMIDFDNAKLVGYESDTVIPQIGASSPYSLFIVRRDDTASTSYSFYRGNTATTSFFISTNLASGLLVYRNAPGTAFSTDETQLQINLLVSDGTATSTGHEAFRNNVSLGTNTGNSAAIGDVGSTNAFAMGSLYGGAGNWDGPILAVISCPLVLSTAQRNTIFNALDTLFPSAS